MRYRVSWKWTRRSRIAGSRNRGHRMAETSHSSAEPSPTDAYIDVPITIPPATDHIRLRPAMYIGDTGGRGLHLMIFELIEKAVISAASVQQPEIQVFLYSDGSCRIADNSGESPVARFALSDEPNALDRLFTEPCRLQGQGGSIWDHYCYPIVNALSTHLLVGVGSSEKSMCRTFERGIPQTEMDNLGDLSFTGMSITFRPDPDIFGSKGRYLFDLCRFVRRLRELAGLNAGIRIRLVDSRDDPPRQLYFSSASGIVDLLPCHQRSDVPIHPHSITFSHDAEGCRLEGAMHWVDEPSNVIATYVNSRFVRFGGPHVAGMHRALTRAFRNHADKPDNVSGLTVADVCAGLSAVVSIALDEPPGQLRLISLKNQSEFGAARPHPSPHASACPADYLSPWCPFAKSTAPVAVACQDSADCDPSARGWHLHQKLHRVSNANGSRCPNAHARP